MASLPPGLQCCQRDAQLRPLFVRTAFGVPRCASEPSADQLEILVDLADEWPALKSMSIGAWSLANLANACTGGARYLDSCNASGWIHDLKIKEDSNGMPPILGTMAPSLYKMSALKNLALEGVLFGPLDPNLGELKSLLTLSLSKNNFSTPFPSSWSGMTSLSDLIISDSLTMDAQPFPSFIGSLPEIRVLQFSKVNFTGSVPDSVGSLTTLTTLFLSEIPLLMGPIPNTLTQCSTLKFLQFNKLPSLDPRSCFRRWMQQHFGRVAIKSCRRR